MCPLSLPHVHSLKLLQLTHQLCLLLRSHTGKDGALNQDLGAQGGGGAEAATGWGWGSQEERAEQWEVGGDQGGWGGGRWGGKPYLGE